MGDRIPAGAPDVGDLDTRRTRLLAEQCATCVFRPGNLLDLAPGRLRQLVDQIRTAESYLVCHETLPRVTGAQPAVCRGFHDRYDTNALRIIRALWGFVEVPAPTLASQPTGRNP